MAGIEKVIGGKYLIKGILGEGGTARVYLAVDQHTGMEYALKEITALQAGKVSALAEMQVKEKLFHPSLAHLWNAWEEQGSYYLLMDYVKGKPLDTVLKERGALPQEKAVDLTIQLCKVLRYLHGFRPTVIYRDMKPSNVILQEDGRVKLVDFGSIRQLRRGWQRDEVPIGTPGYAAPEQFGEQARSDIRTDLYSLGVTFYHMLTGHDPSVPPYQICPIREWNKSLSPSLERIVEKCTRKSPVLRYQNAESLLKDLEQYREADHRRPEYKIRCFLEKFS